MSHQLDTHLSSRQVYLNSSSATQTLSAGEHIYVFSNDPIVVPPNVQALLSLESMSFCNSAYNVDLTNNKIAIWWGAADASDPYLQMTIPPGFYDNMTFCLALDEAFAAISKPILCTHSSVTGRFTLKDTTTSPVMFRGIFRGPVGASNFVTNCLVPFGYDPNQASAPATSGSVTLPLLSNLSGLNCCYVKCVNMDAMSMDSRNDGAQASVLARIDINANPGDFVFYTNTHGYKSQISNRLIQTFHIRIEDQDSKVVDLKNIGYSLTLQIDFLYTKERIAPPELSDEILLEPKEDAEIKSEA